MTTVLRYTRGDELEPVAITWYEPDGTLYDFSSGWTWRARIGTGSGFLVEKTTGFTGAATAPNLSINFTAGELDGVVSGTYHLDVQATLTATTQTITRTWMFQVLAGVGTDTLPQSPTSLGVLGDLSVGGGIHGDAPATLTRVAGAVELPNGIRTHFDPHVLGTTPFGGIEGELIDVGASAMDFDGAASRVRTNGLSRISLPAAGTSNVYYTMTVPEWWLPQRMNVLFDFINDHSNTTGSVRMQFEIKEVDLITSDTLTTCRTDTATVTLPMSICPAGAISTGVVCGINPIFLWWSGMQPFDFVPSAAASIYALRITRLGDDAADTFAGPIGIVDLAWGRIPL